MISYFSPDFFKKFRKAFFSSLFFLVFILLFAGCGQKKAASKAQGGGKPAQSEAVAFAVNTTTAVKGQISDYLALSGDIIAGSTVDAYSDAAGKISRLYVAEGSRVSRGQAIAAVDPSKPGMDYVASIVRAPITGTVASLPAQLGMTVSQSVPIARISGGSGLETRVYVAERYISKIAVNQTCEIILDAYPGEPFKGSVTKISPTVDPASRTMEVRINVSNSGAKLKAGMFAKVRIITEKKDNIVKIPASALLNRFGEDYVFTAKTDPNDPALLIAKKNVVKPGILVDNVREIQEGLAPDEEIIVKGQTMLNDGSRINIIERVAPLPVN